jgi:hypothetical protein
VKYVFLFLLPILTSCVVTGDSKLNVRIIDKQTRRPVAGTLVTAQYLTMFPAAMAVPRVVKRTSDANGSVTFERLADGCWNVTAQTGSGEQQDTFYSIYEKRLSGGSEDRRTKDGGYVGGVSGDPYATPVSPMVFYGKLVP